MDPETPETPPAPETPPETPPVATGPEVPDKVDEAPDPAKLQEEIKRLQEAREKAERDARHWREEKARARAEFFKERAETKPPAPADPGIGTAPKQADFDDYDKYLDAKVAHETRKARAEWDADQERKNREGAQREKMANLRTRLDDEGYKKYSDFEDVAKDPTLPITPVVAEILADMDAPHDVVYHLGKNRAQAIAISRMTPTQAARELARIEMTLAAAAGDNPRPPKLPSAPPPINPLGANHAVSKSLEKMSQREFEAEMDKRTGYRF